MVSMSEPFFFFLNQGAGLMWTWSDACIMGWMERSVRKDGGCISSRRPIMHHAFCFASCFISIASYWGSSPSVSSFNVSRHLALTNPPAPPAEQGHMTRLMTKDKRSGGTPGFVLFFRYDLTFLLFYLDHMFSLG